jgi:putative phosphonate metabolism protein
MERYTRYAVYFTPEPGPLCDFVTGWLGWDPAAGRACDHPALPGLPAPVSEITATPRRYGFHGTLKPPFRLASASSPSGLNADFDALAATTAPAEVDGLRLARLGGFLALVPVGDMGAVARIAAEAVAGLDRHRAPAPPEETERRRATGLTPRQEAHLVTWGYPYVMDEFRFHLTLTGRLAPQAMEAVEATLRLLLTPLLPRPFVIGSISLMGEDAQGLFHTLRKAPLTG